MTRKKTNKLKCIITGRELFATKDYYKRKIEKAGSEETLHKTYMCREAKNLIKQGTSVDRVREILNVTEELPEVDTDIINEVIKSTVKTHTRRINNIISTRLTVNNKTDPEVKEYINNLIK